MDISTIYPLILAIQGDSEIALPEKIGMYTALDSYITRRFLCGYTTKNYNKVFLDFIKHLDSCKTAAEFETYLKTKTGDTNLWPTDNLVREKLMVRPLYKEEKNRTKSISNILLEIEKFQRGKKQEKVEFVNEGLTIEHVLPQNWYEHWPLEGNLVPEDEFEKAVYAVMTEEESDGYYHKIDNRNKKLHCLGNLTLLTNSLNPSVSNSSYEVKRKELAKQSTLLLNTYFIDYDEWDEESIDARSKSLIDTIIKVWAY